MDSVKHPLGEASEQVQYSQVLHDDAKGFSVLEFVARFETTRAISSAQKHRSGCDQQCDRPNKIEVEPGLPQNFESNLLVNGKEEKR